MCMVFFSAANVSMAFFPYRPCVVPRGRIQTEKNGVERIDWPHWSLFALRVPTAGRKEKTKRDDAMQEKGRAMGTCMEEDTLAATIHDLPMEMLSLILTRGVEPIDRVACRRVSRSWRDILRCGRRTPSQGGNKDKELAYIAAVAKHGYLSVFCWAMGEGCTWDAEVCSGAAEGGHLEVLKWARSNGCPWSKETCRVAARGGHLEVLKWARSNGCQWDRWACAHAALGGHLDVLKWARANWCQWDKWTCTYAAKGGHLEVLKWAKANGCSWDRWTCANAALGGHIDILKWARANGCPWDSKVCLHAAEGGHLAALWWAHANGCPMWWDACRWGAKSHGRDDVVRWIDSERGGRP